MNTRAQIASRHPAHSVRSKRSIVAVSFRAAALCCLAGLGLSRPAAAATFTQTITLPVPPATTFAASAGGDGWDVALSNTQVFNVLHHNPSLNVVCHNQLDASVCWPTRTITDGTSPFATSGHPGLVLDKSAGKLYVYATRSANQQGGVVCIDTAAAATSTNPFCGFAALTGANEAPIEPIYSMSRLSMPMVVGTKVYAFNYAPGAAPGGTTGTTSENRLLCFDWSTGAACAGQPFAVDLGSNNVVTSTTPSPATNAIGSQMLIPVLVAGGYRVACFDGSTQAGCAGTWPVTTGTYAGSYGPVLPLLDASGSALGFCIPNGASGCFTLAGAAAATPAGFTSAISTTTPWQGPAVTLGPRVYTANGNTNNVQCYDYSTSATCTGFPKTFANLGYIYTVNKDPARPSCLWVNSDNGSQQIQNFDGYTLGACNSIRVLVAQFVVPQDKCNPAQYDSLQMLAPAPGSYSSATIEFDNGAGNSLGIPSGTLDATGTISLAGLSLNSATGLPQFLIALTGAPPTLGQVTLKLTWEANYDPACAGPNGPFPTPQTTTTTTSLSGGTASGATITVPPGTAVTDKSTLAGPNAAGATGTVTYAWYSDAACTVVAAQGSPLPITTSGALPDSEPVTLGAGTYYSRASYSGDAGNLLSTSGCGEEVLQVQSSNHPPVASAGPDQTIKATRCERGIPVTVDGSRSSDPDGDPLSFVWTESGKVLSQTAVAHLVLAAGIHTLTLTVTDSHGASATDTVVITIVDQSRPPKRRW